MATTDTKVSQLIINKLTQAQYDGITTPSSTELYFVDDGKTYVTTDMLAQVATTGSYTDLSNKPTNVSSFANDAGYLTSIPTASASVLGGVKVGTGLSIDNSGVLSATGLTSVDWSDIENKPSFATVATSGSYNDLLNKPTIPTVNDATLTIQKNGTSVGTFTANASSNATIDISVPTKTSDLNNNSGFIDKNVNDLTNYTLTSGLATVATTGSYTDLTNKPSIPTVPTDVSAFTNDADYQSGTQVTTAITNAVGQITQFDYQVVQTLPSTGVKGTIYLVPNSGTSPNIYDEYIWIVSGSSGSFEKIGTTEIDLSNYVTDSDLATELSNYTPTSSLATVATSGSYNDLSNKPTIPTVNNATLTIQKNGTTVNTFTANASSNVTANITVPTATSDLNNDSGFITSIPTASSSTLGGVKVGSGLSIDNDGVLSALSGFNALTITITEDQQDPGYYVWSGATLAQLEAAVDAGKTIFVNDASANYTPLAVTNAGFYGGDQDPEAHLFVNNGADVTVYYLYHDNAAEISEFNCITSNNHASTSTYGITKLSTSTSSTSTTLAATPSAVKAAYDLANSKQDALTAGTNITISGNTISATDTTYTAGTGLDLTGTQFSIDNTVALKSEIPTATSDLNNDSGFITKSVNDLTNYTLTSSLATVATSGSYNDLSNKPTIPAAQVNSDWNASSGVAQILNKPSLATVATTGAYSDLSGTPTIPTVNNATLTITQNGTSAGTFTANASSNATIALTDTTYSAFTGTDGTSAGAAGLVPAPATTDADKFLKADGTWTTIPTSGISYYTLSSHNTGVLNLEDTTMTMDYNTTLADIRAAIANNVLVVLPIVSGEPSIRTENCILSSYESVSQGLEYQFSLQYNGYAYRMVVEAKGGTGNVSFIKVAPTPTFTTNEWNALWA